SPYFTTANGGASWDHFAIHNYMYSDTTVAWSPSSQAYAAILVPAPIPSVVVNNSPNPQINDPGNQFTALANSAYSAGPFRPDQPHLIATNVGGNDLLYVGIDDLNQGMPPFIPGGTGNGKTAMVRYSPNPKFAMPVWTNVVIETVVPGIGGDGAVYMAANQ